MWILPCTSPQKEPTAGGSSRSWMTTTRGGGVFRMKSHQSKLTAGLSAGAGGLAARMRAVTA